MENVYKVIVDTDMAPDDWVAILYLLQNRNVYVMGISVAGTGEAHGLKGAINASRLASLTGKGEIPIAYGRPKPLECRHRFPWFMRLVIDSMMFIRLPKAKGNFYDRDSVELMRDLLEKSHEKIDIIALGPLTNIAELFIRYPKIKDRIGRIHIMGGAVDVPGNIKEIAFWSRNEHAEWNTYCDPHATNIVFQSGVPVFLVPLDATDAFPIEEGFIKQLRSEKQNPLNRICLRVLNSLKSRVEKGNYFLWDLVAAIVAVKEGLGTFEKRRIWVVEDEGKDSGRMKDDPSLKYGINVCKKVDKSGFEQELYKILNDPKE